MSPEINHQRRRFFGIAAMTIAAAEFGMTAIAKAAVVRIILPAAKAGEHTSFEALKQVKAGVLDIGYAEAGPKDGPVVLLVHGWPYDIYSYVDVAPILADAGYRVIIPYLRGYGTTRFLADETPRNGQQAALAADMIASWMHSESKRQYSADMIGAPAPLILWPLSGPNAARRWFPSAAI